MINRRQFVKGLSAATALGVTGLAGVRSAMAADELMIKAPALEDKKLLRVSDRVFTFFAPIEEPTPENKGFFSNPCFVVTSQGVVVIDTGSSVQMGEMIIRAVKKVTDLPIIRVINTHMHGDHWLGNHAFVEYNKDMPLYAHPYTIEQIKDNGQGDFWLNLMNRSTENATYGTIITAPNKTLEGGEVWTLGDRTLKIHFLGQTHTKGDLIVEVVEDKVMLVGDMIMDKRISNMADGSFDGTLKAMETLVNDYDGYNFVPGHGNWGKDLAKNYQGIYSLIWEYANLAFDDGLQAYEVHPLIMKDPRIEPYREWVGVEGDGLEVAKFLGIALLEIEKAAF
jgi:glyoxylase-like metal-dependent hydrolase (beta-lactamase superfamily II)